MSILQTLTNLGEPLVTILTILVLVLFAITFVFMLIKAIKLFAAEAELDEVVKDKALLSNQCFTQKESLDAKEKEIESLRIQLDAVREESRVEIERLSDENAKLTEKVDKYKKKAAKSKESLTKIEEVPKTKKKKAEEPQVLLEEAVDENK